MARRGLGSSAALGPAADHRQEAQFFVIDATQVAQEVGLKSHTNTVLQTCFFALSGVLPREQAIEQIKAVDPQDLWSEGRGGGAAELQGG